MRKYQPGSGTEGDWFISSFCCNCIHGKYELTGVPEDNPCEIITGSFVYDLSDPKYPEEWQYDENGKPTCTSFVKWDWGKDDDGNWIDPPPPPIDDPNQLCLPFLFDELGIKKTEPLTAPTQYSKVKQQP